ncbi:unnamed protein product [Paramecium octaurelia]|uniref:Uncharacterized protein n=1 Tax=Paramecium octaurelia TaxID=43137 RepID=A0A8S1XR53_PAROT|nr:unnamed protein product [Paramecium octaurelia]
MYLLLYSALPEYAVESKKNAITIISASPTHKCWINSIQCYYKHIIYGQYQYFLVHKRKNCKRKP